jgi:L1 cell adhesion molecule like protein
MCKNYFDKCITTLSETIKNSGLSKEDIDDIVLVGGSSRIPKIQQKIKEFFNNKKELSKKINPDEAVAIGAAIEAVLHNVDQSQDVEDIKDLEDIVVIDVVPLSLGIGSRGGVMSFIIKRNTQIPCENTDRFVTIEDNQTSFGICVYEGERQFYEDNLLLDEFNLENITPAPKGETAMLVTFKINENYSLLDVMVVEEGKENNNIPRTIKRKYRDEDEIEKMIEIGKKMREEDKERKKKSR